MNKIHFFLITTFLNFDKWLAYKLYKNDGIFKNMTISAWWGYLIQQGKATKFHYRMNHFFNFLDRYLDWIPVIDMSEYDYSNMGHCEKWYHLFCRVDNYFSINKYGIIFYGKAHDEVGGP